MKFQRLCVASTAVLLTLAGAETASAAELEKVHAEICLPYATATAAIANARSAGYVPAPDNVTQRLRGFQADGEVLWKPITDEIIIVVGSKRFTTMAAPIRMPLVAETCAVVRLPAQPDIDKKLSDLLAVGPVQTTGGAKSHVYELTAGGRVPISSRSTRLNAVASAGKLRIVTVTTQRDQSAIVQIAPHQPTDAEYNALVGQRRNDARLPPALKKGPLF